MMNINNTLSLKPQLDNQRNGNIFKKARVYSTKALLGIDKAKEIAQDMDYLDKVDLRSSAEKKLTLAKAQPAEKTQDTENKNFIQKAAKGTGHFVKGAAETGCSIAMGATAVGCSVVKGTASVACAIGEALGEVAVSIGSFIDD